MHGLGARALVALLALLAIAVATAQAAMVPEDWHDDLDGPGFREPEGPVFAPLADIEATLNEEPGASAGVSARILDLVSLASYPVKKLVQAIRDAKTRLSSKFLVDLSRNPDLVFLQYQLFADVGVVPNKQPLCPCRDEDNPRPMGLVAKGTNGGSFKQAEAVMVSSSGDGARREEVQQLRRCTDKRGRADDLKAQAARARSARQRQRLSEEAERLMEEATVEQTAVEARLLQPHAAAADAARIVGFRRGVPDVAPAPAPATATMYGNEEIRKYDITFRCVGVERCECAFLIGAWVLWKRKAYRILSIFVLSIAGVTAARGS